jgi:hypothetical protein
MWSPVAGMIALTAVYVIDARFYYWLLLEDHAVEWLQFALLVVTVWAAGSGAVESARRGRRGPALLMLLMALGAFGLAGEEISWGERVFGLVPPTDLVAINQQQELNVHNVTLGGVSFNLVSDLLKLLLGVTGITLALLARTPHGRLRPAWLREVAPPVTAIPGFAILVLYGTAMGGGRITLSPALVLQEWAELCLYLALAVTTVSAQARAAAEPLTRAARPPRRHRIPASLVTGVMVALGLTAAFATLTARSGMLPGNVPPSLTSLYYGL